MKAGVVGAVVVVIILASASLGYFVGVANQKTVTSLSATIYTQVSTTVVPSGISVTTDTTASVQLNATVSLGPLQMNEATVSAEVYNPLPTNVTLTAQVLVSPTEGACGYVNSLIGVQFYLGHYGFSNLSSATPLVMYNATGPPPPCPPPPFATYIFLPNSDRVLIPGSTPPIQIANRTVVRGGYWTPSLVSGPGGGYYYQPFNPGNYTVLIFDAWGQQMLEYFQILGGIATPG